MTNIAEIAPNKIYCEFGGKHVPRTLEARRSDGKHIKFTACRKCSKLV